MSPLDPPLAVGSEQLLGGKYLIRALIAEGGMGVVYRALHVDLECEVALKVMRDDLVRRDEAAQRMLIEARAAASLRSQHVARVLDVGRTASGAPFLVMELLIGEDLDTLVQREGPLAFSTAADFVLEACEAVAEAHARGIIHRDLKPENLFLASRVDGARYIKVLDFGVAKDVLRAKILSVTDPKTLIGSPQYMAPEQMRPKLGPLDHRADLWALGAILYELVTGRAAFEADTLVQTCHNVLHEPVQPPSALIPELPRELERVLLRSLEKKPDERFQSAADFALSLAPFASPSHAEYAERTGRVISKVSRPMTWGDTASIPAVVPPSEHSLSSPISRVRIVPALAASIRRRASRLGSRSALAVLVAVATGGAIFLRRDHPSDSDGAAAAVVLGASQGLEHDGAPPRADAERPPSAARVSQPPAQAFSGTGPRRSPAFPPAPSGAPSASVSTLAGGATEPAPPRPGAIRPQPASVRQRTGAPPRRSNPWDRRSFGGRR